MAVEPTSLAMLECDKTGNRSGAAWQAVLSPFTNVEFVISDAAKGIAAGRVVVFGGGNGDIGGHAGSPRDVRDPVSMPEGGAARQGPLARGGGAKVLC